MRLIAVLFLLLVGSACGAEPASRTTVKFDPARIDVVGTRFITPEQLERELVWHSGIRSACYEMTDPEDLAKYLHGVLVSTYQKKGFVDVQVSVSPTADSRFQVEIGEGQRYRYGDIEVVGANLLDTQSLIHWLQRDIPKPPADVVLKIGGDNQPALVRLPNGELEQADDESSQSAAEAQQRPEPGVQDKSKGKPSVGTKPASQKTNPAPATAGVNRKSGQKTQDPDAPKTALWITDAHFLPDDKMQNRLKKWLPLGFARQGFHDVKFQAEVIPDKSTATMKLRLIIDDEGPVTRVGAITVRGNSRSTDKQVVDLLTLEAGQPIHAVRIRELEQKLADCGRYLIHRVTVAPPDQDGVAKVYVDLREAPRVPPLNKKLSEQQQLLVNAAQWINRWRASGEDLVLECRWPYAATGTDEADPSKVEASRSSKDVHVEVVSRVIASADAVVATLEHRADDRSLFRTETLAKGGEIRLWSSKRQLTGKIPTRMALHTHIRLEGIASNLVGTERHMSFGFNYTSNDHEECSFDLSIEPSALLTASTMNVRELDGDLVEFSTDNWSGDGSVAIFTVHRPSGRPRLVSITTQNETSTLSFRPNALRDTLHVIQQQAAGMRKLPEDELTWLDTGEILSDVVVPYFDIPYLNADQRTFARAWLSTLDLSFVKEELQGNRESLRNESLFGGFFGQMMAGLIFKGLDQSAKSDAAPEVIRPWIVAAQALSSLTGADPLIVDSAAGELTLAESPEPFVKAMASTGADRARLADLLYERITHSKGYGPLTGWAAANSPVITTLGLQKRFAVEALHAAPKFSEELGVLLAPETSSRAVALALLDQLRVLTPEARESLPRALSLSEVQAAQLKLLWPLLDSMKAKSSSDLLPILLTTYWETTLRSAVVESLENVILEGVAPEKQHDALLAIAKPYIEARNPVATRFWLDRAERRLENHVRASETRPGQRERVHAIELEARPILWGLRGGVEYAEGNFKASRAAYLNCIDYLRQQLNSLGDGPSVDGFLGSLTRRGKIVRRLSITYSALSGVEWELAGREAALQAAAHAEQLIDTLSEAAEIETADVDLALPICHQSRYWSCADKDGSRDAERAMTLAKKALNAGGEQHVEALDAYACALAATGNFAEADIVIAKAAKYATGRHVRFIATRQRHLTARKMPVKIERRQIEETLAAEEPVKARR